MRDHHHIDPDSAVGPALSRVVGWDLLQFGGWDANWSSTCVALEAMLGCEVPQHVGECGVVDRLRVIRIARRRLWVHAPCGDARLERLRAFSDDELCVVTELGHSRVLFRLFGHGVRDLMAALMPIDFHSSAFARHSAVQSQIHHVPVMALLEACETGNGEAVDLYVPRTFAHSIGEWIVGRGALDELLSVESPPLAT